MSDEMKHTPGPWRAQTFAALDGYEVVSDSWDVVSASLRPAAPIRKLSDARLIAAAPDLLEVTKAFRQKLTIYAYVFTGDTELRKLLVKCDAAITKATGGNDECL